MSEMNDGIQIILNRMKTNPEEFFEDGGRWKWIFKEVMREVMTETEKVAIHEQQKQVRRMEITAKAAATILKVDEQQKEEAEAYYGKSIAEMAKQSSNPKKLVINAAQAEMIKRMNK